MNPYKKQWNKDMMRKLAIPENIFPDIAKPGSPLGAIQSGICQELGIGPLGVISVTGHDTACAIVASPATEQDFIYISCGTWSLFGTETREPLINEKSFRYNITNEGGYDYTNCFLKNIIGLWLIQETRRQYRREGAHYSYGELGKFALEAKPFQYFIDPDAPEFGVPGNMPERIRNYCRRSGQGEPETIGEIVRCIYESLAMKYRQAFEMIQDCTGKAYHRIHMIGGGTQDSLLCRMTADATATVVMAGPIEATAFGNIAVQLMSQGEIGSLAEARQIMIRSSHPAIYEPSHTDQWDEAYGCFCHKIFKHAVEKEDQAL